MTSKQVGIEDARRRLGDLITAAQQGTDIILTRNGKPAARLVAYQGETMLTVTGLAAHLGMSSAPEKVARFAGAFEEHDPRTGRLPKPWAGQGMAALFTREQADELTAEWNRNATSAERLADWAPDEPEFVEIADRYQP